VQSALATLMKGRTSFMTAHRLSIVVNTDRIAALAAGRIIERGPRAELARQGGYYASLARRQRRGLSQKE
jgi:ATP-binding cassette subfamily B protein